MPLDTGLLLALVEATQDSDENLTRDRRDRLDAVALLLAARPRLALAWGQVLTEHTAPPVEAAPEPTGIPVHPFFPASPHRIACMAPAAYGAAGPCGEREDAPVHRVEKLSDRQRHLLEQHAAGPMAVAASQLICLGLVEWIGTSTMHGITPRGRAWLEAHPREGGERE